MIGLIDQYQEFKELSDGKTVNTANISNIQSPAVQNSDSIINEATKKFNEQMKNLENVPGVKGIKIDSTFVKAASDSLKNNINKNKQSNNGDFNFSFNGSNDSKINRMVDFQKKHPEVPMDQALDSLELKKELWNRFLYTKAKRINNFMSDTDEGKKEFIREMISYASVSIFILLPIFTLFLKFVYIRRRFTYVEHLIFVFHTQTVFFILLTIFFLAGLISGSENVIWIFNLLFLIYLLIAMKKFYQQGYFKTFFKFLILNFTYLLLASIGFSVLLLVTFAIY